MVEDLKLQPYAELHIHIRMEFQVMLGCLRWIARVRPDISYACNALCRVSHAPDIIALKHLKRVFKYLKGTIDFKLEFNKSNENSANTVWGYADASFGEDPETSKSHGGTALFVGDYLVCNYSRLQPVVSTSTFESGLVELTRAAKELLFALGVMNDIGLRPRSKPFLQTDSQTTLTLLKSEVLKRKSKHMAIKLNFLRDLASQQIVTYLKVDTKTNVADVFTKPLGSQRLMNLLPGLLQTESRRPVGIASEWDFDLCLKSPYMWV